MPSLSERDSPGCLMVIAAYCLGCYLLLPFAWVRGEGFGAIDLAAPSIMPFLLFYGMLWLAAHDALFSHGWFVLLIIGVWSLAFLGALEFLRSRADGIWYPWRLFLFASVYLFLIVWTMLL